MIIIKDISESLLEKEIPGTLNALREISPRIESLGFDICIRDTEHTYDSLRIYPIKKELPFNFDKKEYYTEADYIINYTLRNTCCQCGNHQKVNQYPYDDKNDWGVCHFFLSRMLSKITSNYSSNS